jgi:hypothetical protein
VRRLAVVLAVLAPLLWLPGAARADAPLAVGWWSTLSQLPPAPDLADGDLLLQGGDPQRFVPEAVAAGVISTDPMPTALAALRYELGPDATAGDLVLPVATGAQAMDTRVYATTSAWQPAVNGPMAQAPKPDLTRYVLGALSADGTSLRFPDAGKLATDTGELSLVLVAGPADRVVVHAPPATALAVTRFAPPFTAAEDPVLPRVDEPAPVVPATAPLPGLVPGAVPLPAPQVPTASVAPSPQAVALPVSRPAALLRADDSRTRVLVGLQALLVLVFFGLLGSTRFTTPTPAERGIGRFRAERSGSAPRI